MTALLFSSSILFLTATIYMVQYMDFSISIGEYSYRFNPAATEINLLFVFGMFSLAWGTAIWD